MFLVMLLICLGIKNLKNTNWIIYQRQNGKLKASFLSDNLILLGQQIIMNVHVYYESFVKKGKLQQVVFNHSPNIDLEHLMNLYERFTAKPYSFLGVNTTLVSDNP